MPEADPATAELARRELRDPRALRAIAHPIRLRLLEELVLLGSATATELSEVVGQSPANCSWHLRQLARYGYIEEAPGGRGRQRPWRLVAQTNTLGDADAEGELRLAADAAERMILDHEVAALHGYAARRHLESTGWRKAAFVDQFFSWFTEVELAELGEQVMRLCLRYADRIADPRARPDGARPVRVVAWAVPARLPTTAAGEERADES